MDFAIWIGVFAVTYWATTCISEVQKTGLRKYVTERTLVWRYVEGAEERSSGGSRKSRTDRWEIVPEGEKLANRVYEIVTDIDFTDKGSKAILRIVLVNFIILAVTSVWLYGIMALIIYSAILYFVLKNILMR